jgi:hypothetical protein
MDNFTKSRLIDLFWAGLTNWDWESWQSAGAEDKETIVTDAIIELGIDIDINEAYDLFWEWAEGLEENSFRSGYSGGLQEKAILESSLTAEEKVDAWHNGTRRENYKAAGIPKLQVFLEIAKRKGYNEIVDIIEGELAKRGAATTSSVPAPTTPVSDTPEEPTPAAAPVKDAAPAVTLSEKDLDALLGMAIQKFGTYILHANSEWKSAGGFIGSYSLAWRNGNGNPVKSDRAIDKVMNLAYDHDKLIVLVSYFHGGSRSIDRYYSIDVPSSTSYIVDRRTIYKQARESYSYYDSELNWTFYTLTKNKANQKKVKMFLLEKVPALAPEQAEEITIKFFER